MIRYISEKIHIRPSDIWDQDEDLMPLERIYLDFFTLTCRSELASKTMNPEKAKKYMESLERQKTISKFQEQKRKRGIDI